jgi:hypothetical protein
VELSRRLITLIFAGRNRKVMISRELPRTRSADWARKPYRIEVRRILLFVCPCAVIGSVFRLALLFSRPLGRPCFLAFGLYRNRPDET